MNFDSFVTLEYSAESDVDFLKKHAGKSYQKMILNGEEVNIFDNLVFDKFDIDTFMKLSYLASRLLRNCNKFNVYEIVLKLTFWLISRGEEYLSINVNGNVAEQISILYSLLAFIICEDEIEVVPFSTKAKQFDLKKNPKVAVEFLEKAHLLDPSNAGVSYALGLHYFFKDDYYAAFGYLINARSYYLGEWNYTFALDYTADSNVFTELGVYFEKEYKEKSNYTANDNAFLCFERAYLINKENKFKDKVQMEQCLYNMAYVYIKGIGTKENINKGLSYLKELDKRLTKAGDDIKNADDPDGIIKEYYK